MNRIWAPWRIDYIREPQQKGCLFCNKAKSKKDKQNYIIHRTSRAFIIMNKYPYNNGHLMIVPYKHTGSLEKLGAEDYAEIMLLMKKAVKALKKCLNPHGYNIGFNIGRVAGAGIQNHIHMHIVPRWNGDTNFMPVTGETKIISQSLSSLYDELNKNI